MELERKHEGIYLRGISRAVNSGLPNVKRLLDIFEKEKASYKVDENFDLSLAENLRFFPQIL